MRFYRLTMLMIAAIGLWACGRERSPTAPSHPLPSGPVPTNPVSMPTGIPGFTLLSIDPPPGSEIPIETCATGCVKLAFSYTPNAYAGFAYPTAWLLDAAGNACATFSEDERQGGNLVIGKPTTFVLSGRPTIAPHDPSSKCEFLAAPRGGLRVAKETVAIKFRVANASKRFADTAQLALSYTWTALRRAPTPSPPQVSDVSWCVHGIGKDELRLHCSAVDVDGDALTLRIRLETDECRARAQCFERSATFPARAFQNEVGFSVENPLDPVVTLALKGELTCTAEDSRGNVDSRTRPIANVGATWCN